MFISAGATPNSGTLTEDTEVYCYLSCTSTVTYDITVYPMLEAGSSASSYSPYSNICPISGFTGLNVYGTGKNLLDPDKMTTYGNGKGRRWYYNDGIMLKGGQTYTLSVSGSDQLIELYFIDKLAATTIINASTSVSYTPSKDTLVYLQAYRGTEILDTNNFQLELGSTATSYSPYVGTTLPVFWQSEAGTVYAGYLSIDKDGNTKVTGTHGIYTFSGDEQWTTNAANPNKYFTNAYLLRGIAKLPPNNWSSVSIQTSFGFFNVPYDSLQHNPYKACIAMDGRIGIHETLYTGAGTLAGQQILYELATPVTYTLSSVTAPSTVQGENNWWHDANGNITMTYLADGNASEIEALNILLGGRYVNNHTADEPTDREALDILLGGTR